MCQLPARPLCESNYLLLWMRWLRVKSERPHVDYQCCICESQASLLIWMRQFRSTAIGATHESYPSSWTVQQLFPLFAPTLKERISKFSISTMSSRPGSMRLLLRLVRGFSNVSRTLMTCWVGESWRSLRLSKNFISLFPAPRYSARSL